MPLLYAWIFFNVFALAALALDFFAFQSGRAAPRTRKVLIRCAMWFALAMAFAALIFFWQGRQVAIEFVTGYLVELSLSVDNLFLFLVIFRYFAVPEENRHRVLFWGILGALLMRGILIIAGIGLVKRFHWIFYGLGLLLIYSGFRLGFTQDHQVDPGKNPAAKALRRLIPVTTDYQGNRFLVRGWQGSPGLYATPLLIVLVVIETTDLLFALDSIPAVMAVTLSAFIVYSSNVFAIIGLRSLFFAVSGLMKRFRYLHSALALILVLMGLKIMAENYYKLPTLAVLCVVSGVLLISALASILHPGIKPNENGD
jgi:tellurite resistance protein TerC